MNGIININKPTGMTSSDVVVRLKGILRTRKVGHTGTLDPGAAGVLPILIGKATKLFDYVVEKNKTYIGEITFGSMTDTLDANGKVIKTCDYFPNKTDIINILPSFTGDIIQIPPMYSAILYKGQKLYDLARKGETVKVKPRSVTIYKLQYIKQVSECSHMLRIECSPGTYIRTLFKDIAEQLNSTAHLSYLLRTEAGDYNLSNAMSIEEVEYLVKTRDISDVLMPMDMALSKLAYVNIDLEYRKQLINGVVVSYDTDLVEDSLTRLYLDGSFIGIGIIKYIEGKSFIKVKNLLVAQ